MTRAARQQLKEIDGDLLRACLVVDGLIRLRAVLDVVGTQAFIEQLRHTLTEAAITARTAKGGTLSKSRE